jgi:ubiquinone/menaquinone biosynthesis C-methylase UbiE
MKYFDKKNNRLIFVSQKATSNFWDTHWNDTQLKESILAGKHDRFVAKNTKSFIPAEKTNKILEGGCGKGQFVYSLKLQGYDSYGIDYAEKTVTKINTALPELKVTLGDVTAIDFPDSYFNGYWSLGVIEHFYSGYTPTLKEMHRVIKPNGYLFLTFPYMSPLRRLKASLSKYTPFNAENFDESSFYQFALNYKNVQKDLEPLGFTLVKKKPFDGIKGLKDEISITKPLLQKIYDSKNIFLQIVGAVISRILAPFSSHSILLIFKKNA